MQAPFRNRIKNVVESGVKQQKSNKSIVFVFSVTSIISWHLVLFVVEQSYR
jgi:hypothetical protein